MTQERHGAGGLLDPDDPPRVVPHDPAASTQGEGVGVAGPLTFTVRGRPAPQGSKRHVGHGRMVESSKALGPWREAVRASAVIALDGRAAFTEPVAVALIFRTPRPRSHYGTGRNGARIKPDAPTWPGGKPDVDKLARAVLDGMVDAGVMTDDALVCELSALKTYAVGGSGVSVVVQRMPGGTS